MYLDETYHESLIWVIYIKIESISTHLLIRQAADLISLSLGFKFSFTTLKKQQPIEEID